MQVVLQRLARPERRIAPSLRRASAAVDAAGRSFERWVRSYVSKEWSSGGFSRQNRVSFWEGPTSYLIKCGEGAAGARARIVGSDLQGCSTVVVHG